ncbi:group III truncated hemoglobin [Kaistia dalseonensis]|uniref:group III truncated hemoglobin n=1 Tax=Kaistia dalseonensis TaxID=410840 RepID=UPI00224E4181|nr:group III truncated hemoglobin [Kaistia dalseonensis]MCX5493880.1 group III truncated hemoglobin [Kaistia dalseonensis]
MRSSTVSSDDRAGTASIDETGIRKLVYGFYDSVRGDPLIGPVFEREIEADQWPVHLAKMCDFWSSVLLRTRRYSGRPMAPHLRMEGLSDAHFERWLTLFQATAHRVFDEEGAAVVMAFAERIAQNFRLSRALHRGEDTTRMKPLRVGV